MKTLVKAAYLFLFLALSAQAHAANAMFGKQDFVRFVADIPNQNPGGTKLYIGHRITMHTFLMPYFVESKGLVLGVASGNPNQRNFYGDPNDKIYYEFPTGEKLAALQREGHLPKELPKAELAFIDYLLGFALELFVIFISAYLYFKK